MSGFPASRRHLLPNNLAKELVKLFARGDWDLQSLSRFLRGFARTDQGFPFACHNTPIISSMSHPLAGSRAKSKWALEHLKILDKEIKAFYETQPYEFVDVFNPQTGDYHLVATKVTPTKQHWPLMIGDIIQNLRASLDYAVWQMTIADGHAPPDFPLPKGSNWRHVQFPIFLDQDDFNKNRDRYLWGISDQAERFVKRKQPFGQPNHPLWWLAEFSNIDKHRALTITSAYLRDFRVPHPPGTQVVPRFLRPPGFLEHKAEIAHVTIIPPRSPVNMERGVRHLDIVFGKGMAPAEGENVINALGKMGIAVEKVLEGCRPYVRKLISHLPPSKG